MQTRWFGDSRDYAKWDFVYQESLPNMIVCYIGMVRPNEKCDDVHSEVKMFFDKHKHLDHVGDLFPNRYCSLLSVYRKMDSEKFFNEAVLMIRGQQKNGNILIFVDPDTGIEPRSGCQDKHIRLQDVFRLADSLSRKDKLIIYQHAPIMRPSDWIQRSVKRITDEPWSLSFKVSAHSKTECASDVCFILLEKQ